MIICHNAKIPNPNNTPPGILKRKLTYPAIEHEHMEVEGGKEGAEEERPLTTDPEVEIAASEPGDELESQDGDRGTFKACC